MMSEADVSTIQDEDVLRRMWQQTEDFSRKKQIRAHMCKLREERLRSLYTQDDAPAQRTVAKGHEFTESQGHTKSFANQSFQSIKSKEVRDAGSPPRDYSYHMQDHNDNSNSGWTLESENKTVDDGHTHVRSIEAKVAGQYGVDGGCGRFAAVDQQKQAFTEYQDDHSSFKRNETASATSVNELFSQKNNDGTTFSSTATSSSSTKTQQVSSTHQEAPASKTVDFSSGKVEKSDQHDHDSSVHTSVETVSKSQDFKSSLRSDREKLTSRTVEYPDENTKIIVKVKTLPDGTQVTSTKREVMGTNVQSSRSEQHSQKIMSENRSLTSHSETDIGHIREEVINDNANMTEKSVNAHSVDQKYDVNETKQHYPEQQSQLQFDKHMSERDCKDKLDAELLNTENIVKKSNVRNVEESMDREESVEKNIYQTTYQSDYSQKKISSDLSPTHQAWASTLRADTPSTIRPSSRGSSPFHSSTSSLRSSVSPDKYTRNSSSRGRSPNKAPVHAVNDHTTTTKLNQDLRTDESESKTKRYTSPDRKTSKHLSQSPSPTRRPTCRYVDDETKRSTSFDSHYYNSQSPNQNTNIATLRYAQSPENPEKSHERAASPTKSILITKYDHKTTRSDHSLQSSTLDVKRQPSPPKVSFKSEIGNLHNNTEAKVNEANEFYDDIEFRTRTPSPTKPADIVLTHQTNRYSKSPEKKLPAQKHSRESEPAPSKFGTYKLKNQDTDTANKIFTRHVKSTTCNYTKAGSPNKNLLRDSLSPARSPIKDAHSTADFLSTESIRISTQDDFTHSTDTCTRAESPNKSFPRSCVSPEKLPSKSTDSSTDFIAGERNRKEISQKTSNNPRQLVTPSTSPTRKPKEIQDAPSTGQSSPTTSVSEIMYFNSPRDHIDLNAMVTDLDDEETFLYTTTQNTMTQSDLRPMTLDVKRSQSPSKIPCSSPGKQSLEKQPKPRKSSLKKSSSDNLQVSPSEKPLITIQTGSDEYKNIPDHKIVKKDRAEKPDSVSIFKERPPFTRSETYEERCRKILGMGGKDSLTVEAEKTVSRILDTLPLDLQPTESTKTSSSISPCCSPTRDSSPLTEFPSQRKSTQKKEQVADFILHEKETGERTTTDHSKVAARESSPTKLLDIIFDSTDTKSGTTVIEFENSIDEMKQKDLPSKQQFSVSPQIKHGIKTNPVDGKPRSKSPIKYNICVPPTTSNLTKIENITSPERKQAIIDRVQRTLRNISPAREVPDKISSPTTKNMPSKKISNLENNTLQDTRICSVKECDVDTTSEGPKSTEKYTHNTILEKKGSKPNSRNVSPTKETVDFKTSKTAPKLTAHGLSKKFSDSPINAAPEKKTPQIDNQAPYQKERSNTKLKSLVINSTLTEDHQQRKPADRIVNDSFKHANLTQQSSFSKQTTVKTHLATKAQLAKVNKITHLKTRVTPVHLESDSEDEQVKLMTLRRRSSGKIVSDNKTNKINKENFPKPAINVKITRTSSEIAIKTAKGYPIRMKSKPEFNVSSLTKTKTVTKQTAATKPAQQVNRLNNKTPKSNLNNKPKSATTLNYTPDNDGIIIDIQQAKSSRENSPDRICPTPVDLADDTGKPRLPDDVSEPDDEQRNRVHTTIHEQESLVDDIVEISEDEEIAKINEISDDCLLSVNEKVNKFLKEAGNVTKKIESTSRFKEVEREFHSNYCAEDTDDCLLTVSEKVSKFTSPRDKTPQQITHLLSDVEESNQHQADYTYSTVNDKTILFLKTAKDVAPAAISETAPKVERPAFSSVHESLSRDECLPSVSEKAYKFENSTENIAGDTKNIQIHSKTMKDVKTNEVHENKTESYAKETVSSHAKVKDCANHNLKMREKKPMGKITSLCSSEAVKKAKALFENIVSQQTGEKHESVYSNKGAKLTDIGVYKKSTPTDSTMVLHPSDESDNDIDIIDMAPEGHNNKNCKTNGTQAKCVKPNANGIPKSYERTPYNTSRESPERRPYESPEYHSRRSPQSRETTQKHDGSRQEVNSTYNIYSRFPVGEKSEPIRKSLTESPNISTDKPSHTLPSPKTIKTEKFAEEGQMSSRTVSGKFGVELRRTSHEKVTTERRRSSANELHHQPCIEDIFDLQLLEQMLEKVVGYEQRRRIRAQIRLTKNMSGTGQSVDTNTYSQSHKKIKTGKSAQNMDITSASFYRPASPEKKVRQSSPEKKICRESPEKKFHQSSPVKKVRHQSPDNNIHQTGLDKKHQASPDKKSRTHSPNKNITPTAKSKSNRFHEYASAYMKKVGLGEPIQAGTSDISMKTFESNDHRTQYSKVTKMTVKESNSTERRSSKQIESTHVKDKHTLISSPEVGRRAPSPIKKVPSDHIRPRTPSPDFKRPRDETEMKSKSSRLENENVTHKTVTEDKPSWVTNRGLNKTSLQTRTFSSKKVETEKSKYRSKSPLKVITKPTDAITSSYGLGPVDADGKPLFGLKALRTGVNNLRVKGTVIRSEYHSTNGSAPEGTVSVTAYSTNPDELARLLESQGGEEGPVKDALQERQRSRIHGLSALTTTKKFGGKTGSTLSNVHTKEEQQALQEFTDCRRSDKKTVRQSSVKSLTEKFIKNAVDTSKSEKSSYPKAGLILRSTSNNTTDSDTRTGLIRTDSEQSFGSNEGTTIKEVTMTRQGTRANCRHQERSDSAQVRREEVTQQRQTEKTSKSFLDSNTKVTGVQDILTRMKNADIVVEDGDTTEDAEARSLLNKFLGATVLMAGMESYVTEKPAGRFSVRTETKSNRTVGGHTGTTSTTRTDTTSTTCADSSTLDLDRIWDEQVLNKLLEECTEYEQRRRIRARLRQVMAEQEACAELVRSAECAEDGSGAAEEGADAGEREEVSTTMSSTVRRNSSEKTSQKTVNSSTTTTSKSSKTIENVSRPASKPASPFAKFRQLEKQNSTSTPTAITGFVCG